MMDEAKLILGWEVISNKQTFTSLTQTKIDKAHNFYILLLYIVRKVG